MLELKNIKDYVKFDPDEIARAFAHIEETWPKLTVNETADQGTLIGLPQPYIVPSTEAESGFVFREMYYWDSYFILQGLIRTGRQELAEGILENLIYLSKRLHVIPNANRFYFTSRSQPPLLTSVIFKIYDSYEKNTAWLKDHIAEAEKEYKRVWIAREQPNIRNVYNGLSRYYDINLLNDLAEAESGWDMTTRFNGECLSFVPVCLNSLLYKYEMDFARAYKIFGEDDTSDVWHQKAQLRAKTIEQELWHEDRGFYFDFNYKKSEHSQIWSLAGFYPMWAGMVPQSKAKEIVSKLHLFMYEGGLSTSASPQQKYDMRGIPKQWAYPNGWAPLNWLAIQGLVNYGFDAEAEFIARTWLKTNLDYFANYGVFREAYNVISPLDKPLEGVYPPQVGFAWTNAVFVDLAKQFLTKEELKKV